MPVEPLGSVKQEPASWGEPALLRREQPRYPEVPLLEVPWEEQRVEQRQARRSLAMV